MTAEAEAETPVILLWSLSSTMNKFLADNNKFFTKQLFWEQWSELPLDRRTVEWPPFCLHRDRENCINFGKEYVKYRDPTGYKVATKLLGDYQHWIALNACTWFKAAREMWDEELDQILKEEAFRKIRELMVDGQPAQQLAAAKYLANAEHRREAKGGKGRPSKEAIEKETRRVAAVERELADDFQRIRAVS